MGSQIVIQQHRVVSPFKSVGGARDRYVRPCHINGLVVLNSVCFIDASKAPREIEVGSPIDHWYVYTLSSRLPRLSPLLIVALLAVPLIRVRFGLPASWSAHWWYSAVFQKLGPLTGAWHWRCRPRNPINSSSSSNLTLSRRQQPLRAEHGTPATTTMPRAATASPRWRRAAGVCVCDSPV